MHANTIIRQFLCDDDCKYGSDAIRFDRQGQFRLYSGKNIFTDNIEHKKFNTKPVVINNDQIKAEIDVNSYILHIDRLNHNVYDEQYILIE